MHHRRAKAWPTIHLAVPISPFFFRFGAAVDATPRLSQQLAMRPARRECPMWHTKIASCERALCKRPLTHATTKEGESAESDSSSIKSKRRKKPLESMLLLLHHPNINTRSPSPNPRFKCFLARLSKYTIQNKNMNTPYTRNQLSTARKTDSLYLHLFATV